MSAEVAVLGTGLMATGIAACSVASGFDTVIVGRTVDRARQAREQALDLVSGDDLGELDAAILGGDAIATANVILETVAEDLAVKRQLLADVERRAAADALLATNTSSLRISAIAEGLARPERVVGLHFLNPAHRTAIAEVVPGRYTTDEAVAATAGFARRLGKRALVLHADVPGFIWNRLQFAVLRECLALYESGVADVAAIDAAVSDGLAPRWTAAGPLATADLGGLPTFARVAAALFPRLAESPDESARLVDRAQRGETFYEWSDDSRAAVAALRSDALDAGEAIRARRDEAFPVPRSNGTTA